MSDESRFDLGDYVEVKDRIRILYELYANARLVTDEVQIIDVGDGKQRVMVRARAYRSPDDPLPGVGYSWMEIPGTTPYTRGSELENTETSAWGRAIAALGILVAPGIATAQEVRNKTVEHPVADAKTDGPWIELRDAVIAGVVEFGAPPVDGGLRQTPDGPMLAWKLKPDEGRTLQVVAYGALAEAVESGGLKIDDRLVVSGDVYRVPWQKNGKPMRAYQRLTATKVVAPGYTVPA